MTDQLHPKTDDAFAAGFFEGEGNVNSHIKPAQGGSLNYRVQIGQKDPTTLYWLQERFGGRIYKTKDVKRGYSSHTWHIHGNDVYSFLQAILPYTTAHTTDVVMMLRIWEVRNNSLPQAKNPDLLQAIADLKEMRKKSREVLDE